MGVIGEDRLTLLDVAKQRDSDGKIADVLEVLSETNAIVQDGIAIESSAPTGHRTTLRSSLPTVGFSRINRGVTRSKATTKQRTDTIGIIQGLSEVDTRQKITAGGEAEFNKLRWNLDQAFLEAMAQKGAETIIYGNEEENDAAFTGLDPRFSSKSGEYANQLVDAGGTGSDNTSLWIIDWHPRYCALLYPKGSKAGMTAENKGEQRVTDADGNPFMAAVMDYTWALGLTVGDHRHVARICNIDVSDLANAGEAAYAGAALIERLIDAWHKLKPANGAVRVAYCNSAVLTALDKLALNKANVALGYREWHGEQVVAFRGAPIREVEQITSTEARIT